MATSYARALNGVVFNKNANSGSSTRNGGDGMVMVMVVAMVMVAAKGELASVISCTRRRNTREKSWRCCAR